MLRFLIYGIKTTEQPLSKRAEGRKDGIAQQAWL